MISKYFAWSTEVMKCASELITSVGPEWTYWVPHQTFSGTDKIIPKCVFLQVLHIYMQLLFCKLQDSLWKPARVSCIGPMDARRGQYRQPDVCCWSSTRRQETSYVWPGKLIQNSENVVHSRHWYEILIGYVINIDSYRGYGLYLDRYATSAPVMQPCVLSTRTMSSDTKARLRNRIT